ncbi:hypothetical protein SD81_040300 [Tolypothrix campylonemoides VB511288]|nr:hypothetical protein SD81_040300 [Tolypothrix campylonemoides VB511288]
MEIRYSVQYNLNGHIENYNFESRFYNTTVPIQVGEILSVSHIRGHIVDLKVTKISRDLYCNETETLKQASDDLLHFNIECEVVNVTRK